jgi:hypothetical protein
LFSAPLFFGFAAFFSHKNFLIWRETPPIGKVFLVLVPSVLYLGGLVNIYQANNIFKVYQSEKELWKLLDKEGVFEGKDQKQCEQLFDEVKLKMAAQISKEEETQ